MRLSTAACVGGSVLVLSMGYKLHDLGVQLEQHSVAAASSAMEVLELRQLQRGLMDLVNQGASGGFALSGVDVTGGTEVAFELSGPTVIYFFGTHCLVSPTNVEVLNELHARGLRVLGVVPTEPVRSVEVFVRSHSPEFPILAQPSGTVLSLLPRGATPLTAVIGTEGIERVWLGPLDAHRLTALEPLVSSGPTS